jgi:sporulation-control protein spo0M
VSFFKKIKQGLGIGTVKLNLEVPPSVSWESSKIEAKVTLTAKSDQKISSLIFKLTEEFTTGRGENKETQEFQLGTGSYDHPVEIKANESKTIEFSFPFTLRKSPPAPSQKTTKFAGGDKSDFRVSVEAKIEGTMFSPDDSKFIAFE